MFAHASVTEAFGLFVSIVVDLATLVFAAIVVGEYSGEVSASNL